MAEVLRIALVGGGIGGLTAALALGRSGFDVHVFEQSAQLNEIGAGITLSPNAVKVLRALGLEHAVKQQGFESNAITGRDWITGQTVFRVPLGGAIDACYKAPHIDIHRADMLDVLETAACDVAHIHLDSRCVAVSPSDEAAFLAFSNGRHEQFDLIVGCDGIRSFVRESLWGKDKPRFTGNMCWRALISADTLSPGHVSADVTIWMGPGGHVVTYYVRGAELVNVVAVREVTHWTEESWSIQSTPGELVAAYPDVHKDLRILLESTSHCFKWGLFDRDPLAIWSKGRATLLGDAAHPMLPFLGQGAAMAIEDAYVLARELARSPQDVAAALRAYETERTPRTAQVQHAVRRQGEIFHAKHAPTALEGETQDLIEMPQRGRHQLHTDWLYSYDPTN
jgi:2-polyprenyl-6-methoxyphenol hydroxylase-like FAD-dependent oxidoreductase